VRPCPQAEITKAYRRAALRWHPDKAGGDEAARAAATHKFVAATEAFRALTSVGGGAAGA